MIWFTSDLHFGHANLMQYEPKRQQLGTTIYDVDATIISRIREKVKPGDTLYILGDVGLTDDGYLKRCLECLDCKLVLVMGNHDRRTLKHYLKLGFDMVCYEMKMKIAGQFVWLNHYPYRKPWWKVIFPWQFREKDRHKRPVNRGHWLLHGHIHTGGALVGDGGWKLRGQQINVGVDAWDYYPVSIQQIEAIISSGKSGTKD